MRERVKITIWNSKHHAAAIGQEVEELGAKMTFVAPPARSTIEGLNIVRARAGVEKQS